jgi:periplasmic protein TonB
MDITYENRRRAPGDPGGPRGGWRRWLRLALTVLLLIGAACLVWRLAGDRTAVKRAEAPRVTTVIPVPPPPPPPQVKPPPKPQPVEQTPVARPMPTSKPAETPHPTDNQPKQMTMNAPAQAGSDNFNIGAGDGGGMVGSGGGGRFGNTSYRQYLAWQLQQAVERDRGVQDAGGDARFSVELNLWMAPDGRITRVTIGRSTGDEKLDAAVVGAIESLGKLDEVPPPAANYPVLVKLNGRRPG